MVEKKRKLCVLSRNWGRIKLLGYSFVEGELDMEIDASIVSSFT
jgi:hypothetical protein